jgi:hypothetical protein
MNMTQRKIKHWAQLMLVLVLFAQGTLAAHACVNDAEAMLQVQHAAVAADMMPCHEVEISNKNACQMHCTQSEQLNLDQQNPVAVAVSEVILQIELPAKQYQYQTLASSSVSLNTGPPLSIRFCSFLI